jgi:Ca2+-binding EF-hand superfamily protein
MSDEEIAEIIALHGKAGDGLVTFEDFKSMIISADDNNGAFK